MTPKTFISRRWLLTTLLVIAGIFVLIRLGLWQLDRLAERRAENTQLIQQLEADPLMLNEAGDSDLTAELEDRRVIVRGTYDFSQQILLKLQMYNNQPGGHLVAPLLIEGSDQAVLIDRGWLPDHELDPANWSTYDEAGVVTISGYLKPTEVLSGNRESPPAGTQLEWFRINIDHIQLQMPYDLLPIYVLQAPTGDNIDPPLRAEPEIDLSEGPHLSYALQWFAFTIMLGGGYIYFVRQNEQKNQHLSA